MEDYKGVGRRRSDIIRWDFTIEGQSQPSHKVLGHQLILAHMA